MEWGEAAGEEVGGAVGAFEGAVDEQGVGVERDAALSLPDLGGADDVDHAGLVFEVDEHHTAGGGWALAVGDEPADPDPLTGAQGGQVGRGGGAGGGEVVADVLDGVAVGGDAGGPEVGEGLLGLLRELVTVRVRPPE